jgi:hypothetical protein
MKLKKHLLQLGVYHRVRDLIIENSERGNVEVKLKRLLNSKKYTIFSCFIWSGTKEGVDYWHDLERKIERSREDEKAK